jgi:hypothetical protein
MLSSGALCVFLSDPTILITNQPRQDSLIKERKKTTTKAAGRAADQRKQRAKEHKKDSRE